MTPAELDKFLTEHQHIEYSYDKDNFYFKNTNLPWYQQDGNCTAITRARMNTITENELLIEINRGLQVEQITRVTGYFSKVGSWNAGKRAELKDRVRCDGSFRTHTESDNRM